MSVSDSKLAVYAYELYRLRGYYTCLYEGGMEKERKG